MSYTSCKNEPGIGYFSSWDMGECHVGALATFRDSSVVAWGTTLGGAIVGSTAAGTGGGGSLFDVGGVIPSHNISVNLVIVSSLYLDNVTKGAGGDGFLVCWIVLRRFRRPEPLTIHTVFWNGWGKIDGVTYALTSGFGEIRSTTTIVFEDWSYVPCLSSMGCP